MAAKPETIILNSIQITNDAEINEEMRRKIFLMIHSSGIWTCTDYKTGLTQNEEFIDEHMDLNDWEIERHKHSFNAIDAWLPCFKISKSSATSWTLEGPSNTILSPNYYKTRNKIQIELCQLETETYHEDAQFDDDVFVRRVWIDPQEGCKLKLEETIISSGIFGDGLNWNLQIQFIDFNTLSIYAMYKTANWKTKRTYTGKLSSSATNYI